MSLIAFNSFKSLVGFNEFNSLLSFIEFIEFNSFNLFISLHGWMEFRLLHSSTSWLASDSSISPAVSAGLDKSESETTSNVKTCGVRADCVKFVIRGSVGAQGSTSVESVSEEVDRETSSESGKRWEAGAEEERLWR